MRVTSYSTNDGEWDLVFDRREQEWRIVTPNGEEFPTDVNQMFDLGTLFNTAGNAIDQEER